MSGVAIVGSGWGPNIQIPAFRQAGINVIALVGRSAEKSAELAKSKNVPHSSNVLGDILKREDVDFVSVVTPPSTHAAFAIEVLQAGKHLLTEKPFALNVAEAKAIQQAQFDACKKFGRPIIGIIDHELRFHRSIQQVKQFILSGAFGKIHRVFLSFIGMMPPKLQKEHCWWHEKAHGGGVAGAIGSHYIDLLSYITSTEIVRIQADLKTIVKEKMDPTTGTVKPVTSDDSAEFRTLHRSNPNSSRPSFRANSAFPQEFTATTTLEVIAYGVARNELILMSDKGAIVVEWPSMKATYTAADRDHPDGNPALNQVWTTDAPAEVAGSSSISPFAMASVTLGQRLSDAIQEVKQQSSTSASTTSSTSSSASLTALPASLSGVAATFADGVYCQTILDAAHQSSENDSRWIDCVHEP